MEEKQYSDYSTAGMILGILAVAGIASIVTGILAIVFSKKTLDGIEAGALPESSYKTAKAGHTMGIVGLSVWSAIILLVIIWGTLIGLSYTD